MLPGDPPVAIVKHASLPDPPADHPHRVDTSPKNAADTVVGVLAHVPDIEDSAWFRPDAEVIVPASDEAAPSSPPKLLRGFAGVSCGSEDLLVAESESEDGGVDSPKAKAAFDLGRYMFGGPLKEGAA